MEKNYINWQGKTHFYVDLETKEYGVLVSTEDTPNTKEIIKQVLEKYKAIIESWKKEWEVMCNERINDI